uniref:Uncharacterized protein n=1 Tax=Hyaloperonospora arabidopsidis (strain Emoy2) TaxID=559515 RepID=M4B9H3_HYAAE
MRFESLLLGDRTVPINQSWSTQGLSQTLWCTGTTVFQNCCDDHPAGLLRYTG